ncbi:MAG: copper chaperone PCu(A)C [Pseudomonadota bacterium]
MLKNLVLLLGLSLSGFAQADGHLMVDNAWVREAPPGAMALAGYMKLHNHADVERVLIKAESPAFESVMLHKTVMEEEVSKMMHQHMVTIPANGMVSFEPNSYHLMMMKPKQALKSGDKVGVTLHFKNGGAQQVEYVVRAAMGEMNHGGHDMH